MHESIFYASIRAFFIALFSIMGLIFGILLLVVLLGGATGSIDGQPQINYVYTPEILPNAAGIRKDLSSDTPVILKINLNGIIGLDGLKREKIEEQLVESQERTLKGRVKAILLHINSPGGTVIDADGIYRVIKHYKETHQIPVYAYTDGLCASGGYYVASVADKINSSEVTLIGSVGVIIPTIMNFSQLIEKWGIQSMTLYDGKGKDNMNPFRPWHKGEEDNIKDAVNYYYGMFVNIATANRPSLDKTKLIDEYGANVYPAAIAKELGFIDQSGSSLSDTIKELAEKIQITDDNYQVISLESKSWVSELFTGQFNLLHGRVTHRIQFSPETNPELMQHYLYLYRP